jgi:hypothetical protein
MTEPAQPPEKARLDNYKLYRPEAIKAHASRRAGEPWAVRLPLEGWIIVGIGVLAALGCYTLFFADR